MNGYQADVQPGEHSSDEVKGLHQTKKVGFERTSSNPTGSSTA